MIYKWILYITVLFFTAVLESTLLSKVNIAGGSPRLLPFAVSVIAMFEGVNGGASAGLAAGIIADAMSTPAEGFYTAVYVICGVVVSILNAFTYRKTYPVSLLFWIAASVLGALLYYVFYMLILGKGHPVYMIKMLCGELCATVIFTPVVYFFLRLIRTRYVTDD